MKNLNTLTILTLVAALSMTACSQKPSSEEIAAQVKIALEQEKAKEAANAAPSVVAPVAEPVRIAPEAAPVKKEVAAPKHVAAAKRELPPAVEAMKPLKLICSNCGVVVAVNMLEEAGKGSGLGVVAGGVVGGLVGNQVGDGTGRQLATLAGVVGGAFAGNAIEKNAKKTKSYDIVIRMEDGSERTIRQATAPSLVSGDKVKIENDVVVKN